MDTEVHAPSSNLEPTLSYFKFQMGKEMSSSTVPRKIDILHCLEDFHKVAYQLQADMKVLSLFAESD
jgi:hypothetical protein